MYLTDLLPSSSVFTLYSATPPIPAYNTNFAADTCVNYIVKGTYKTTGNCPSAALQNKAILTSGASVYKDSVCVNVRYACTNAQTLIIADSTFSNPGLLARYDTASFYIAGRLYVNDSLTFASCNVIMAPGAQIIVMAGGYLNFGNSTVAGCLNMWRGIAVNDGGELIIQEFSHVNDADTTVTAYNLSKVTFEHARLKNFVTGIYTVANGSGATNHCNLKITYSLFDFSAFKNPYAGQAAHGFLPKAGIMLNGWNGSIGSYFDSTMTNTFSNLNCGILAWKSNLTVNNCKFNNMQPDFFYTWTPPFSYHGTAVYNSGDMVNNHNSSLTVKPVPANGVTINNCHQGIKAYYSHLTVNKLRMDSVAVGIHSQFSKGYLTGTITNNEIKAKRTGINLQFNAGANKMVVSGNRIYGKSSNVQFIGINLNEGNGSGNANYLVKNNYLYLSQVSQFSTAIKMQGLYQDSIVNNYMEQNTAQNFVLMGLSSYRCNNNTIQCNQVRNFNITNTNSRGYSFSLSNNNLVSCNSADSTGQGFHFGGQNNSTQLSGNTMRNNELGLYIQNGSVIGVQSNAGNLFIDYRDTIGAFNANTLTPAITGSRFDLKAQTQYNSWYFPELSANNLQDNWFVVDPSITNTPFSCGSTCFVPPIEPNNELYYRIIANDSIITNEFIPESQSMARQYLFEVLNNNPDLLASDILFQDFYDKLKGEAEGQLNAVERNLEQYGKMDSTFILLLNSTDSLISSYAYLSEHIDSICDGSQNFNCDSLKEAYSVNIDNLCVTRQNIIVQYNTVIAGVLQDAQLVNNLIQPEEIPELHSKRLNEIFAALEESQYRNIDEYYTELYAIATQCPYYGGEAVYRARAILELYDENLSYDDDLNCLVYGYYRKSGATKLENERSKILVKPNPANEYISVTVTCNEYEMFSVQIINTLNQVLFDEKLQCNKENEINTKQLSPGVYTFIVKTKEGISSHKIAIIRW